MNVNKRIGRLKQWAGERMGGEVKTNLSDNFKAMETEMAVRHEGMTVWMKWPRTSSDVRSLQASTASTNP
jgi:hypothetical protein